ncbi:amino acid ABC transporter substrate-binding protein [Geomonas limicola]|uniref:Amino acid ABC transporter substrate-binding protein n=1 Tax=Geomonas limicola TaxID=2740186 RepID=A0A6V8N7B0_9BACT|nr:transporter substrate-binding domain-containing protein [Geomonas limicola]GFO67433.1 amino acid ABC transporter substrate-binding protein [Geomonas limicola]
MFKGIKCIGLLTLVLVLQLAVSIPVHAAGKPLVVGMELAYPPFEMTDAKGKPDGVSVQLAYELGKALGRPVEIRNMAFDGLIPALKTGKIDLIISSMTATPERAKSIDFSDPYLTTGLCLLAGKNVRGSTIVDFDQPGRTIAVKKGTTGHLYASNNLKKAKVLVLDKEAAAVLEVVQGKADAFIYDQMSTYQNFQRNRDTTRPILKPFQTESWAVGIRKGNDELKAKVNRFLFEFRKSGGFGKLGDRYLKEEKDAFQQLGFPFFL